MINSFVPERQLSLQQWSCTILTNSLQFNWRVIINYWLGLISFPDWRGTAHLKSADCIWCLISSIIDIMKISNLISPGQSWFDDRGMWFHAATIACPSRILCAPSSESCLRVDTVATNVGKFLLSLFWIEMHMCKTYNREERRNQSKDLKKMNGFNCKRNWSPL